MAKIKFFNAFVLKKTVNNVNTGTALYKSKDGNRECEIILNISGYHMRTKVSRNQSQFNKNYFVIEEIPQIKTFPSSANFVLIELPENVSSEIITSILLIRYGIYVRNCDDKIGLEGNYLRIASRGIVENKLIFDSLFDLFS